MGRARDVDAYISAAPRNLQGKLRQMRAAIREAAPEAEESISYMMPGYDNGRVAWFGLMKAHIGLYLRPPIIKEHRKELSTYKTTKSTIHFPLDKRLPVGLIKKLVRARIEKNRQASR